MDELIKGVEDRVSHHYQQNIRSPFEKIKENKNIKVF